MSELAKTTPLPPLAACKFLVYYNADQKFQFLGCTNQPIVVSGGLHSGHFMELCTTGSVAKIHSDSLNRILLD